MTFPPGLRATAAYCRGVPQQLLEFNARLPR
jgi:hypothetical protein